MHVRFLRVPIRRDMAETIRPEVGEHELGVLKAVHGAAMLDEAITDTGTVGEIDPAVEFDRFERVYGTHPESGRTYAEIAHRSVRDFTEQVAQIAVQLATPAANGKAGSK